MKKSLAITLALIFIFCFAGCGSSQSEDVSSTDDTVEEITLSVTEFPEFTTRDMNNDEISSDYFSQADLTVVNFWGTFCGPCINEMMVLAEWNEELPDNVQLLGVAVDVHSRYDEEFELAEKIIDQTGVGYTNIMINKDFAPIADDLVFVPTTIFVDSEGNIVGDAISGAYVPKYKEFVEEYLNEQK